MKTSNLSQTSSLAVPSLMASHSLANVTILRVKTVLKNAMERQVRANQNYQPLPFLTTPTLFSKRNISTSFQDWNGYR